MTNFIYNMQDELVNLNMILPVGEFSPIKKLVYHIEAQGKQLRELNAAITKRNKTIEKYECEKKDLQERNSCLYKKVDELNEGIRDSEDLTWKQKYDALLHSSEQAIGALQKKCQEYKNAESDATANTIAALVKENNELEEKVKHLDARIKELVILCDEEYDKNKELEGSRNELKKRLNALYGEKSLEDEKQVSEDLNVIINSKNKLLDEYMIKCDNLEKEKEILSKRDGYISELENEVAGLKKELAVWKTDDKRNFFGNTFDMHSIYDLNRLEEAIAHKIKSYDSRLYSLMAERDKYKESSEEYRLRLMVAERQCAEYKNLKKENCDLRRRLSIIEDTIKK